MAKVREKDLYGYCAEANQFIEQGAPEAAVAIGQHILRHYPKYVEAYRVLAKATLEQGKVGYAADLFKRVLSADPEDLEARVSLGIIYTEEEALEEALWQWDRAFELAPSNSDIRARLRQVRERLEGLEFPRIELTRGALGRLYAQGGLFQQAADEFRAVLSRDPEQIDIQVTLAETLWRDGKLAEAEAVCEQILEALPNCLKANLILGHIWLHTGREEESHGPFRVAQALDPENHVAVDLLGKESPLAREPVVIPQLDELPVVAPKPEDLISVMEEPALGEAVAETELPDWLTQLRSAGMMEEEEEIVEEDSLPDWLTAIEPAVEPFTEPAAEELPTAEVPAPEPPTEAEELPDWLAVLESEEAEEPPTEERPKVETLAEEPVAPEAADRDVPEWLMQLRTGVEQDLTDIGEVDVSVSPLDEDTERFASREVPEWLQDVQEESDLSGEAISEEDLLSSTIEPVEETPEWLAAFQVEEPATPEVETPAEPEATEIVEAAEPAEEIPDWLTALQAEEPATPEIEAPIEPEEIEIVEAAEPAEEIPDWLAVLQAEEPAAPEVSGAPAEPEVTDTDLWREIMREEGLEEMIEAIPAEVEGLPEEVEPAEEIPDWLAALHVEEPGAPEVTEPPAEPEVAEAAEPAEEIPDWLAALHVEEPGAPEVTGPPAEPEVTEIAAEVAEPAVTEAPPEEAEAAEEIPDWLAALQAKEPVAPEVAEPPVEPEEIEVAEAGEPAKELPDWLAALQADEPAAPEVAEAPAGLAADTDLWREIMREEGLEEMIEAAPAEAKDLTEEAEPAEEIPEWLAALQEEEPVSPEVAEAPAELAADTDLWREIMREEGLEEMIEAAPAEAEDLEEAEPAEEIPDWLAALQEEEPTVPQVAPGPAEPEVIEVSAEAVESIEEEELVGEVTVKAEVVEPEVAVEEAEEVELAPEEEAVPDWLASWQEEVELEETAKVAVEAEVEKVPAVEVTAPEVTEKVEVEPVSFAVSSYLSRLDADPDDHEVRLALARAYRDEKKPNNAFEQFQTLVSSGHLVQELLSDLEGLCASHANDARWHQLLGDAYVRTNQLADALNAYRAAQEAILHR